MSAFLSGKWKSMDDPAEPLQPNVHLVAHPVGMTQRKSPLTFLSAAWYAFYRTKFDFKTVECAWK